LRVTVGKRGLADGTLELTERATGNTRKVPVDVIVDEVRKAIAEAA
jgi:prolyl-tRNA synthetase